MPAEPKATIPPQVNLCGIRHNISVLPDGPVLFAEDGAPWSCYTRMMFWKSSDDVWHSSVASSSGEVDPSRYSAAYEYAQKWFGKNFSEVLTLERPPGPPDLPPVSGPKPYA